MKTLDNKIVNTILHRCPIHNINNIKNLNIYNTQSNNSILFNAEAEYFILKPKGRIAYLWFTYYKKDFLAILIIMNNKNINDKSNEFYKLDINFDNTLCYNNVLLYGYYFKHHKQFNYFIIENIFNFNIFNTLIHSHTYNYSYDNKLTLFNDIMPKIYNSHLDHVKIPIIETKLDNIYKIINTLNYDIYSINVYSKNKYLGTFNINNNNINNKNKKVTCTFKIVACVNQDLYNLIIINNNTEEFYDLALIDSYKISIFMNKLFRNIKENKNLDLLEESDNEEEFENINTNKFVSLDKYYNIECEYNFKFKKWMPRKLSNNKIINKSELNILIPKKKNIYI